VQYSEGAELIQFIEEKVILPYARSFSRIVGSRYTAREFIAGETKLRFQQEFAQHLTEACKLQGVVIHQALVRDILPPDAIRDPINEREVARQRIKTLEQQIQVARSQAELAKQEAMAEQNRKIGEANAQVVGITKKAEQLRDVAVTKAEQELAVAKLKLEAAQKQADALVARGQAEASVVLLQKRAEAEPLRQQVAAFGDGNAYARYFFYQKVAPSMKSILTNTDGPFADVFKQFTGPSVVSSPTTLPSNASAATPAGEKISGVQQ
jgi:regulator of protease activity HflC (stomatin/prohibitin superfamily)